MSDSKSNQSQEFRIVRSEEPHVLVVETENQISPKLESLFTVVSANGAEEAWENLKEPFPKAILIAYELEQDSGLNLCKTIKENNTVSHIPVILVATEFTDATEIEGVNAGANHVVPLSSSEELLALRIDMMARKSENTYRRPTFLEQVDRIVFFHIGNRSFNVNDLARSLRINRKTLYRKIKRESGHTPLTYVRNIRICRAAHLLRRGNLTVSQVSFQVGFSDSAHFAKVFKEYFGIYPSQYLKKYFPDSE